MNAVPSTHRSAFTRPGMTPGNPLQHRWFAPALLLVLGLLAYANTFQVPFLLDDSVSILQNPSLAHFSTWFNPPPDTGVSGRPLLNLSYALNYWVGGTHPFGYHVVNLALHLAAAGLIYGILSRLFSRPRNQGELEEGFTWVPLAVSALWLVHPVQTAAVTYISERAEVLMAVCYMASLHAFLRSLDSPHPFRWQCVSVAAAYCGVGVKEIIVTVPFMILFCDGLFFAGTLAESLRRRWRFHLALGGVWLLQAWALFSHSGQRGVGYNQGFGPIDYAYTSCRSLLTYVRVTLWPHPLVFDYGYWGIYHFAEALPFVLGVSALIALVLLAWFRWPRSSFAGFWFFGILAPSHSFIPLAGQPTAEHRVYLSVAAALTLLVFAVCRLFGRRSVVVLALLVVVFTGLTAQRNEAYRDALSLWRDTVSKRPDNPRAHVNFGAALLAVPGHRAQAIAEFRRAIELDRNFFEAHVNLGAALSQAAEDRPEAIRQYRIALAVRPESFDAHFNLGLALAETPATLPEAIQELSTAVKLNPASPEAHYNLGRAFARTSAQTRDAVTEFRTALALKPQFAQAHLQLGKALLASPDGAAEAGREFERALLTGSAPAEVHFVHGTALLARPDALGQAVQELQAAVAAAPNAFAPQFALGVALSRDANHASEAIVAFQRAVQLNSQSVEAWYNLALALSDRPDRQADALTAYREVLQRKPDHFEAHLNLGGLLASNESRSTEAIAEFRAALALRPDSADAHFNLALALLSARQSADEALAHLETARRLKPDDAAIFEQWTRARQIVGIR